MVQLKWHTMIKRQIDPEDAYYEDWGNEIIFLGNSIAEVTDMDFNFIEMSNDSKEN